MDARTLQRDAVETLRVGLHRGMRHDPSCGTIWLRGTIFWGVCVADWHALAYVSVKGLERGPKELLRLHTWSKIKPPRSLWPFEPPASQNILPHGGEFELTIHVDEASLLLGTHLAQLSSDRNLPFAPPFRVGDRTGNTPDHPGKLLGSIWSEFALLFCRAHVSRGGHGIDNSLGNIGSDVMADPILSAALLLIKKLWDTLLEIRKARVKKSKAAAKYFADLADVMELVVKSLEGRAIPHEKGHEMEGLIRAFPEKMGKALEKDAAEKIRTQLEAVAKDARTIDGHYLFHNPDTELERKNMLTNAEGVVGECRALAKRLDPG